MRELPIIIDTSTREGDAALRAWLAELTAEFDNVKFPIFQLITTSGTFTVPAGVYELYFQRIGGPGSPGCGRNAASANGRGGGASGEVLYYRAVKVRPGDVVVVTVGQPGAPTNNLPPAGTDTVITVNGVEVFRAKAAGVSALNTTGSPGGGRLGPAGGTAGGPPTAGSAVVSEGEDTWSGGSGGGGGNGPANDGALSGACNEFASELGGVNDGVRGGGAAGASSPWGKGGSGGSPGGNANGVPGNAAPATSFCAGGGGASGGNANQLGGAAQPGVVEMVFNGTAEVTIV